MSPGLARQSVRGAAWLFGTGYAGFIANFVVNLLIARLVLPEEFGVFAFAFAIAELTGLLAALSVPMAVIHLEDSETGLFDTGAWMFLGIGVLNVLIASVAILFIPGRLQAEAGRFLLVIALSRILLLWSQISSAALEKVFRYRAVSLVALTNQVVPNLLALGMAWGGLGAWSLVGREFSAGLLAWLLTGLASPFRFRGSFHAPTARRIWGFGSRMFISRGLQIVLERFDRLVVGSLLGAQVLGVYDRSRYISEVGVTFSRPADSLSFNVYSRLREDRERLRGAFAALNYFVVRAMVGLSLVLLVFPREVVILMLGSRWLGAAPTLRWMALYAGLVPFYSSLTNLLHGRGMMRESNRIRYVQVGAFIPIFVLWVITFGSTSAGAALTVAVLAAISMMVRYQKDLLRGMSRELFVGPAAAFVLSAAALLALRPRLPAPAGVTGAAGLLLLPAALYGGILLLLEGRQLASRVRFVLSQLQ